MRPCITILWLGMSSLIVACSADGGANNGLSDVPGDTLQQPDSLKDTQSDVGHSIDGLTIGEAAVELQGDVPFTFKPVLYSDGVWQGRDATCVRDNDSLRCSVEAGTLVASLEGAALRVELEASQDVVVEAIGFEGNGVLEGAKAWLSNGFQSWSQTGVVELGPAAKEGLLIADLAAKGDDEVLREGTSSSYWFTWVGGGQHALVAGALSADKFKSWIQPATTDKGLALRLISGRTGEKVALSNGDVLRGESWHVAVNADLHAELRTYAGRLNSRRTRESSAPPASVGWNSWYELWSGVDQDAVLTNAMLATEVLSTYAEPDQTFRIVIDDGWQVAWGDWQTNEKFPLGMDGLAAKLKEDGYHVGIWLAPMLVHKDSKVAAEHPEWLIPDVTWLHPEQGLMHILDVSHPDAAEHLQNVISTIVGWGYDFLKIDFLFAATFEGTHHKTMTGMEHLNLAMTLIREAAGDTTELLSVGAPHMGTLPYVDSWRVGGDIAFTTLDTVWFFIPNQLRSVAGRWALCEVTLCDADPVLLRNLPQNEVDLGGWVVAAGGGGLFLSDDLRLLPDERKSWGLDSGRYEMGKWGVGATPEDLVPALPPKTLSSPVGDYFLDMNSHVVPIRWTMQDGTRVAFNIDEDAIEVEGQNVPARSVVVLE